MTLALPTPRQEAWRYSDLSALPTLAEARPSGVVANDPDALWIGCGGPRLLFVDGLFRADASDLGPIEIAPVEHAFDHPLASLTDGTGWRLSLGRDHAPPSTIEIVHLSTGGANHMAARIDLAEDAQASIVETFAGEGWANRATAITLGRSARLMLSRRVLSASGYTSVTDRSTLGQGASLVSVALGAGGGDTRFDGQAVLAGVEGYAEAGGALLGRGTQRHDANFAVRHAEPNGQSHQLWRMVADDRATVSTAARVEVARDAQKTDGEQSLRGLLLARTATVNVKPELEIFADDVKCAHGATVGELDRNALFYLASRGIPPVEARALVTRAFVADALGRIGEEAVREAFMADADAWLRSEA